MAHVTIHGTLASDPKILSTGGFREIVLLRVVETLEWYDGEGSRHTGESEHHVVIVSGPDAENSMSLRKGDTVLVEGHSYVGTLTDEAGEEREMTQVSALHIGVSLDKFRVPSNRTTG
ncbi:single-stranded DNA-binding protein [Ornithinimicrobium pratense]|nr:single-stranded DNA-binding protein [Ornithinimicrobium pratense]